MIAKCKICDMVFITNNESNYEKIVANHIIENHREQPIDKPLIEVL